MAAFADAPAGVSFPTRYGDAAPGLRLRVFDVNENDPPQAVASFEVGDDLREVVTWGVGVVPTAVAENWGVSMDELVATATGNIHSLPVERKNLDVPDLAPVVVTTGHAWVSSLVTRLDETYRGIEGAIVAIPRFDLMVSAPVVGSATVDSLEAMMLLCDAIFDRDDGGVSPHVWWSWADGLYRITDRGEDGEVDIEPAMNVSAYYFVRALQHLVNPCEECGRVGPA